jgi:ATP-dependent DNA helicase PIF1
MLGKLIQATSLIIWDEAPTTHHRCFEALDGTMRDVLAKNKPASALLPFGGKPIVLGGDFRQILPVVRKGSQSAVVGASITISNLWQHVTLLELHTNMRLRNY